MSRILSTSILALSILSAATAAQAQSYTAPAGIPAAAAPGGGAVEPRGWNAAPSVHDALTTGSLNRRGLRRGEAVRR